MKKSCFVAALALITAMGLPSVYAEDAAPATPATPTAPAGKEVDAFWAQQRAENQAFFAQQRKDVEAFRATLKDKTPEEREAAIKEHRTAQQAKVKEFMTSQHKKAIDHIQSSDLPEAVKAEKIKKLQEIWANMEAHRGQWKPGMRDGKRHPGEKHGDTPPSTPVENK